MAGGATVAIVIKGVDKFSGIMSLANKKLLGLGTAITAVGIAGAGLVVGLTKIAGEFEQTKIAFTTMLGSAEEAQKLLKELAKFAKKTPFTITGIEKSAKQLMAMGIETNKLLPTLKSLGDVAAGLAIPLDRVAYNFGQVKAQGRLTGVELRDFARAGIPLIAELAKNLGVAEKEIKEMVSAGEIGFDDVENAFTTMTSEGGKFFDLMDAQSETLLGQISNIQDSFITISRTMGEVFLPAAKWVAEHMAILIGWFEKHPDILTFTAVILAASTALALIAGPILILVAMVPAMVAGLGMIAGGLTAVSIAGAPVWVVLLAIIAAAALVVAAFIRFRGHMEELGIVWAIIFNIIKRVWNGFITGFEKGINYIIGKINNLIVAANEIRKTFGLEPYAPIDNKNLDKARMELTDIDKMIKDLAQKRVDAKNAMAEAAKPEEAVTKQLTMQEQAAAAGLKYIKQTGDVFNPKAFSSSEFQTKEAYEQARRHGGIEINIDNVNGLDPDEIATALNNKLKNMISI